MHKVNTLRTALFIAALCFLFIPFTAYSQVHVGLVGGVNVSTITDEDPDVVEIASRTRFSLGGVVEVALGRGLSLRTEPTYLKKGAVTTVSEDGVTGTNEFQFSYLEVPLLLSYTFSGGAVRPFVTAGPSVGLFLDADDAVLRRPDGVFKGDLDETIDRFDVGLAFGSGVRYPVGRLTLFAQGRYTLGLTNINHGGPVTIRDEVNNLSLDFEIDPSETKTRGFQMMVGVTFRFGK